MEELSKEVEQKLLLELSAFSDGQQFIRIMVSS